MFSPDSNTAVLAAVAVATWLFTGLKGVEFGESLGGYYLGRAIRSMVVTFLVWVSLFTAQHPSGWSSVWVIAGVLLGFIVVLRKVFTQGIFGMLDPSLNDHRQLDVNISQRYQETISHLIRTGQRKKAIKLCQSLRNSGDVPQSFLDHALITLGVEQQKKMGDPVTEASRLRTSGDFSGAERMLKSLLSKNPEDATAAVMLMRVYAQDFRKPKQAHKILRKLEKQKFVSSSHIEFARRSIDEWSLLPPAGKDAPLPEDTQKPATVEDLIAKGSLGSAVELLDKQIAAHPEDFELQLKLLEIHAVHCGDLVKAEKMVQQMVRDSSFDPPSIARACAKLEQWRAAVGQGPLVS